MTERRGAPLEAIASRKQTKKRNHRKTADAIVSLQRRGIPIDVGVVAAEAGVHRATVRRSGDSYEEIKTLRAQDPGLATSSPSTRRSADATLMEARLLTAQDEVRDLKEQLETARRVAHDHLGLAGNIPDAARLADLEQEAADLRVQTAQLQDTVRDLDAERLSLAEELTAAHEVNREYMRRLSTANDRVDESNKELVRLRRQMR